MFARRRYCYLLFALISAVASLSFAENPDGRLQRGQVLHDQICRGCHEDNMYTERHLSRNPYFDLRMQTRLWAEVVKINWNDAQIDDVVYYLKQTYYSDAALSK